MKLEQELCYSALKSRDSRFDGLFFVGVSSTGIYCRPVCTVRTPKAQNCTFYKSAAAAEAAGYRPCLRCRPELAPGLSLFEMGSTLAHQAAHEIESDPAISIGQKLAPRLGISARHLQRIFHENYGTTPKQYAQTCRLLRAKQLLTDSDLPISDVAFLAGFNSLRSFNSAFVDHYRLEPRDLRKQRRPRSQTMISVRLPYRPPYNWQQVIGFLQLRAITGVETVTSDSYARTVDIQHQGQRFSGWFKVSHEAERNALKLELSDSLAPMLNRIIRRVRRMFDLNANPELISEALADIADPEHTVRLPGCFDPFEMAIRAILGQQITVKAAATLSCRVATEFGKACDTEKADLQLIFPDAAILSDVSVDQLGKLGIIRQRAKTIIALAQAINEGAITLKLDGEPDRLIAQLIELPGIGPWTAQYIAMRALSWPDQFLATDLVVRKALSMRPAKELEQLSTRWQPWRSYAVITLWQQQGGAK